MKVARLNNAVEVTGIDLLDDEQCRELGRILANECVVLIRDKVSEKRLFEIQSLWGQPSRSLMERYVAEKKIGGRHWRKILLHAGYNKPKDLDPEIGEFVGRVSVEKDEKGRATGVFTNGELDWHCDQHAYHDNQRIVGLMSLWGTENSQTSFLCTASLYLSLNHEDKTAVDELTSVYEWDGGTMCRDLNAAQTKLVEYNMVPYPEMECPLKDRTASGIEGIRFPSHCFSHFKGLSRYESDRFKDHLWSLLNRPGHIYLHDWQDGEIIFMDQNITLHARPTNVEDGDTRTLCRIASYLDNIYPGQGPMEYVMVGGQKLSHDEFATKVDKRRHEEFDQAISAA